MDQVIEDMKVRIRNALAALVVYRSKHADNAAVESIMTQLELVQGALDSGKSLSFTQKDGLNFNLVEGTPLEHDEHLSTELYSIRNFAQHSL